MRKTRLFCTIFIFLSALCSSRAQDWEELAIGYERTVFEGAGAAEANAALLGKAECYKQLGRYSDAAATLGRIRMYALDENERERVLLQQELCLFLSGDFQGAAALVGETTSIARDDLLLHALVLCYAGRYRESEEMAAKCLGWYGHADRLEALRRLYAQHPTPKSELETMALSFLPPAGHFYTGHYAEGLLSAGLNAAAAAFTVVNLLYGYWITGIVGGAIALNYTFMGNQERTAALTARYNHDEPIRFGDRVREFLKESL